LRKRGTAQTTNRGVTLYRKQQGDLCEICKGGSGRRKIDMEDKGEKDDRDGGKGLDIY